MAGWEGKTRGGLLGHRIFVLTIRYFGISSAYFLLRFVSFYYFLFSKKSNIHIYSYFHKRLGYSSTRARMMVYRNYYIFGQVLIDKVSIMAGMADRYTFDFDGEEHIREMKEGGILISAHVGNWEAAGNLLNRIETPFNIVMFDEEHRKIKAYLDDVMKDKKVKIIVLKDDLSHLIEIRKALDAKELIIMHGDRYMPGSKVLTSQFLGAPAKFPEGPFYLGARFQVPVSYAFAMKEGPRHYHFYASPAKLYSTGNVRQVDPEVLQSMLQDYIALLEKMLQKYPLQWFNYYGFWG
jgi:predicted LPLAT superfamily acyltransferase